MKLLHIFGLSLLLLAGAAGLQGCGQMGPLYPPPPDADSETDETA